MEKIEIRRTDVVIYPDPRNPYMTRGAFNPGLIRIGDVFYMLIRAVSTDNQLMSNLVPAWSVNGINWHISDKPVLLCSNNGYCKKGVEDPRIVRWNGCYYIFATSVSETSYRIGTWSTTDFNKFQWIGSPLGDRNKDACIFPEKISDSAVLIHRGDGKNIEIISTKDMSLTSGWNDNSILLRAKEFYPHWDTGELPVKIGLGGPPIKIDDHWLIFVHVVHGQKKDDSIEYSMSFAILDKDLERVYIHSEHILRPERDYEINGPVPKVVFSNANVVINNGRKIFIPYGGCDKITAFGTLELKPIEKIIGML